MHNFKHLLIVTLSDMSDFDLWGPSLTTDNEN